MKRLTIIAGVLTLVGLCLAVPRVPTATTLPARPAPDRVRSVDPNAERVVWRIRPTTAPALDPYGSPGQRGGWWTRRTTQSGTWTLLLRGPDGVTTVIDRVGLSLPAGWHADIRVWVDAALHPDPNEEGGR